MMTDEQLISQRIKAKELDRKQLVALLDDLATRGSEEGLDASSVVHIRRLISNAVNHPWSPLFDEP